MSPLHDPSFMAHFAQCKVSAKQQVNSMIDAIYAKVLLDLELWLNKHQSNDSIKSEIDSDCEENVTHHNNLPGQSQFDQSTEAENDHLQNEMSLFNTINRESMIKQEFEDDEKDGEDIDDDSVAKCEKRICTSGNDAELKESQNEHFETQLNVHAASENNQTNQCLHISSITSISLDFANNAALNGISIDEQIEGQDTQIQTDEFDDNEDYDEYLNDPNCEDCSNGICDLNHENNDVSVGDGEETNLDETQLQIDISAANNTQMNNQIYGKCVSERNMEQATPSTSEARSSTRKKIQTKVFGDLVQSNGNTDKCGKRKSNQSNESGEKGKHKQILNDDDEDTDFDDKEDYANNAIGEEIATECITNPIQANLTQPNRHLQCSYCDKSFDRLSNLKRHLRVHTGERPFQCNLCDKRFNDRSNLAAHQLIHQNIKIYQCDHCDKRFNDRGSLARHQLIHQNMKPFNCDHCDKKFNHKVALNNHLLVHSGERPHQCRFCDKSFAQWITRNSHEQAIHLHVKPYRCKLCAHRATRRSHLITHIRVVHFGLPKSIKQQRALNIVDDRDPKEFIEKI